MRSFVFFCLLIVPVYGCSTGMPQKTSFPPTQQLNMKTSHHWDVLAADVANQINNQLIRYNYLETPVYVKDTCGDDAHTCTQQETAPFNEGFRDLLITKLVSFGVPTSSAPSEKAITVNYKAQVLFHSGKAFLPAKPGMLTALTAGIMVFRNVTTDFLTLAAAGAIDFFNTKYSSEEVYEVIITTSLVIEEKYLFRQSDIYYISNVNFWHYQENQMRAEKIQLTDSYFGKPAAPMPPPEMREEETVIEPPPVIEEPTVIPIPEASSTDSPETAI